MSCTPSVAMGALAPSEATTSPEFVAVDAIDGAAAGAGDVAGVSENASLSGTAGMALALVSSDRACGREAAATAPRAWSIFRDGQINDRSGS